MPAHENMSELRSVERSQSWTHGRLVRGETNMAASAYSEGSDIWTVTRSAGWIVAGSADVST